MKKFYLKNLEQETINNNDYRRVIFTTHHSQLVLMSLKPGEEIGNEIHGLDQFIRIESGKCKAIIENGENEQEMTDDMAIIIPAGTWHNIINTGDTDLKLYTLYSGPDHLKDTVQATKADEFEDAWDGLTDLDD